MSHLDELMEEERPPFVSISQTLNIGADLKARLEAVARREGLDARSLGRRVIREAVEAGERGSEVGRVSRGTSAR